MKPKNIDLFDKFFDDNNTKKTDIIDKLFNVDEYLEKVIKEYDEYQQKIFLDENIFKGF